MRELTAKQLRFCREYVKGRDAAEAARKAGYAEKQAGRVGRENLAKANIRACIRELEAAGTKSSIADEREALEYLTAVLRGEVEGIKAADQMKAAELFGKRYGSFAERAKPEEAAVSLEEYLRQLRPKREF